MSLALLHETRTELRRLAIAGGSLAADDFRLKKLIPQLTEAGKTAPGCAGETAILEKDGTVPVSAQSYRILNPLLVALTTKGGGRQEIIEQGIESGAIYDLRLLNAVMNALEDSYAAIPPLIAEVLKRIGTPCVPFLLARFEPTEKGAASALRLKVLGHILGDKGGDLYRTAYDEGTPAVKLAALEQMGHNPDFEPLLAEAAKSRKQDQREAAYRALSVSPSPEGRKILLAALDSNDYRCVVSTIALGENPLLLQDMTDRAIAHLDTVEASFATAGKRDVKEGSPLDRLFAALGGIATTEAKTPAMFELAVRVLVLCLKHPKIQIATPLDSFHGDWYADLREDMNAGLTMAAKAVASFKTDEALATLENTLNENDSSKSLVFTTAYMAFNVRTPEQFFETYHSLMESGIKTPKGEALANLFGRFIGTSFFKRLDPRWASVFARLDQLRLVVAIAAPGQPEIETYFRQRLEKTLRLALENKTFHAHETISAIGKSVEGLTKMNVTDFAADFCTWMEEHFLLGFVLGGSLKTHSRYSIPFQGNIAEILAFVPDTARPMLDRVRQTIQDKKPEDVHLIDSLITSFNRTV